MHYQHPDSPVNWSLDCHRETDLHKSLKALVSKAGALGYEQAAIATYGPQVQIAATEADTNNVFDFAAALSSWLRERKLSAGLYVEKLNTEIDEYVVVEVRGHLPVRCAIVDRDAVLFTIRRFNTDQDDAVVFLSGDNELLDDAKVEGEVLAEPLTLTLKPKAIHKFIPLADISTTNKSSSRTATRAALGSVLMGLVMYVVWPTPDAPVVDAPRQVVPTDPWASYRAELTTNAAFAYERILQDYLFRALFNQGPGQQGWRISQVDVGANGQTYRLQSESGASSRVLRDFIADKDALQAVGTPLINETSGRTSLHLTGRNRPLPFALANQIVDLDELERLFAQAVEQYVPGARLAFVKDTKQGRYTRREMQLTFRDIDSHDLIGFAAMTRLYPVSLKSTGAAVGDFSISSASTLSGQLMFTFVGVADNG